MDQCMKRIAPDQNCDSGYFNQTRTSAHWHDNSKNLPPYSKEKYPYRKRNGNTDQNRRKSGPNIFTYKKPLPLHNNRYRFITKLGLEEQTRNPRHYEDSHSVAHNAGTKDRLSHTLIPKSYRDENFQQYHSRNGTSFLQSYAKETFHNASAVHNNNDFYSHNSGPTTCSYSNENCQNNMHDYNRHFERSGKVHRQTVHETFDHESGQKARDENCEKSPYTGGPEFVHQSNKFMSLYADVDMRTFHPSVSDFKVNSEIPQKHEIYQHHDISNNYHNQDVGIGKSFNMQRAYNMISDPDKSKIANSSHQGGPNTISNSDVNNVRPQDDIGSDCYILPNEHDSLNELREHDKNKHSPIKDSITGNCTPLQNWTKENEYDFTANSLCQTDYGLKGRNIGFISNSAECNPCSNSKINNESQFIANNTNLLFSHKDENLKHIEHPSMPNYTNSFNLKNSAHRDVEINQIPLLEKDQYASCEVCQIKSQENTILKNSAVGNHSTENSPSATHLDVRHMKKACRQLHKQNILEKSYDNPCEFLEHAPNLKDANTSVTYMSERYCDPQRIVTTDSLADSNIPSCNWKEKRSFECWHEDELYTGSNKSPTLTNIPDDQFLHHAPVPVDRGNTSANRITDFSFLKYPPPPLPVQSVFPLQMSHVAGTPHSLWSQKPELHKEEEFQSFHGSNLLSELNSIPSNQPGLQQSDKQLHVQERHDKENMSMPQTKSTIQKRGQLSEVQSQKIFQRSQAHSQSEGKNLKRGKVSSRSPPIQVQHQFSHSHSTTVVEQAASRMPSVASHVQDTPAKKIVTSNNTVPERPLVVKLPQLPFPPPPPHALIGLTEHDKQPLSIQHNDAGKTDRGCLKAAVVIHRPWENGKSNNNMTEVANEAVCNKEEKQGDNSQASKHISAVKESSVHEVKGDKIQNWHNAEEDPCQIQPWVEKICNNRIVHRQEKKDQSLSISKTVERKKNVQNQGSSTKKKQRRKWHKDNLQKAVIQEKHVLESQRIHKNSKTSPSRFSKTRNRHGHKSVKKSTSRNTAHYSWNKLSKIAKPFISTESSGLTSVVNQHFIASSNNEPESSQLSGEKYEESTQNRTKVELSNSLVKIEFHRLGIGHKTMLKPHGEEASKFKAKYLKSSLDLGSMKKLKRIAEDIKRKVKLLEKPRSIVKEVRKAMQDSERKKQFSCLHNNSASNLDRFKFKQGDLISKRHSLTGFHHHKERLTSFHPKLRHKMTSISPGKSSEKRRDNTEKMPEASVVIEKCDKYLNNGDCLNVSLEEKGMANINSQCLPQNSRKLGKKKSSPVKFGDKKIPADKTETEKIKFLKGLELQNSLYENLFTSQNVKHACMTKRGRFTMSTPTTFVVKPTRIRKHKALFETDHSVSDHENTELDSLAKACDAARQCLKKRPLQTCNNQSRTSKRQKLPYRAVSNVSEEIDGQKNENCPEGTSILMKESKDLHGTHYERRVGTLNTGRGSLLEPELPSESKAENTEKANLILQTSNNRPCVQKKLSLEAKNGSKIESKGSLAVNPYTSYLDTPFSLTCPSAFSSETIVKTTQSNSVPKSFSIAGLIESDKKTEKKQAVAHVYHIDGNSCKGYTNTNCLLRNDGPVNVFDSSKQTSNEIYYKKEYGRVIEVMQVSDNFSVGGLTNLDTEKKENHKRAIHSGVNEATHPSGCNTKFAVLSHSTEPDSLKNAQNKDFGGKPFVAIPLKVSDEQIKQCEMVDLGAYDMEVEQVYSSLDPQLNVSHSQNYSYKFGNLQDKQMSDMKNNVVSQYKSFDTGLQHVNNFLHQQTMQGHEITDNSAEDMLIGLNVIKKQNVPPVEESILEESYRRNLFEDIIDDFMQDENFLNNWPEQTSEMSEQKQLAAGCTGITVSEIVSDESTELHNHGKIISSISLSTLPDGKENSEIPVHENNSFEKTDKFVSSRTPITVRHYRKRKYAKRFPVPIPRAKGKEKAQNQEKELYEAAKQFLGDFDNKTQRACRMRKAVAKSEETHVNPDVQVFEHKAVKENPVDGLKINQNQNLDNPIRGDLLEHVENTRKRSCLKDSGSETYRVQKKKYEAYNPYNDGSIDKNTVVSANINSAFKQVKNRNFNETYTSDVSYLSSVDTGTQRKIPVLKIKKANLGTDLPDMGNKGNRTNIIATEKKLKTKKFRLMTGSMQKRRRRDYTDKKVFRCRICRKELKSHNSLLLHYRCVHHWCAKCDITFQSQIDKLRHFRHDHDVKCPCIICGVSFINRFNYKRHLTGAGHLKRVAEKRIKVPEVAAVTDKWTEKPKLIQNNELPASAESFGQVKAPKPRKETCKAEKSKSKKNRPKESKPNEKTEKTTPANGKAKHKQDKKEKDKPIGKVVIKTNTTYCSVCEHYYRNMNQHLDTEKHYKASIDAMRRKKSKKMAKNNDGVAKGSSLADTGKTVKSSARVPSHYQDRDVCSKSFQPTNNSSPIEWHENSKDSHGSIALCNKAFPGDSKDQIVSSESSHMRGCDTFMGIDTNSQQSTSGENNLLDGHGHEDLSSGSIGGLVRESYISLLSSEDEQIDSSYKIYQNLDSNEETNAKSGKIRSGCSKKENNLSCGDNMSETNDSATNRTVSISSEDAEYTESVLSGNAVSRVIELSRDPLSPGPICRIDSYYSLSFKGHE